MSPGDLPFSDPIQSRPVIPLIFPTSTPSPSQPLNDRKRCSRPQENKNPKKQQQHGKDTSRSIVQQHACLDETEKRLFTLHKQPGPIRTQVSATPLPLLRRHRHEGGKRSLPSIRHANRRPDKKLHSSQVPLFAKSVKKNTRATDGPRVHLSLSLSLTLSLSREGFWHGLGWQAPWNLRLAGSCCIRKVARLVVSSPWPRSLPFQRRRHC